MENTPDAPFDLSNAPLCVDPPTPPTSADEELMAKFESHRQEMYDALRTEMPSNLEMVRWIVRR